MQRPAPTTTLALFIFCAVQLTGCGALGHREQSVGRVIAEFGTPLEESPERLYFAPLEVFENPGWAARDETAPVDDAGWSAAQEVWRETFAESLTTVAKASASELDLVFLEPDDAARPSFGLLVSTRLSWAEPDAPVPWIYLNVHVTDLETGDERYFARVEVPRYDAEHHGWEEDIDFALMNYAWLNEQLMHTGTLSPMRETLFPAWWVGRYQMGQSELRYWSAKSTAATAGPEVRERFESHRATAGEIARSASQTLSERTPSCASSRLVSDALDACRDDERALHY